MPSAKRLKNVQTRASQMRRPLKSGKAYVLQYEKSSSFPLYHYIIPEIITIVE